MGLLSHKPHQDPESILDSVGNEHNDSVYSSFSASTYSVGKSIVDVLQAFLLDSFVEQLVGVTLLDIAVVAMVVVIAVVAVFVAHGKCSAQTAYVS